MATSTEQINDLIAGVTDLKAFYEAERAELQAARADLPGQIYRYIYVDEFFGAPGNDGSIDEPYQSIDDALDSLAQGQSAEIRLCSACTIRRRHFWYRPSLRFVGFNRDTSQEVMRNLDFLPTAENLTTGARAGYNGKGNSTIAFKKIAFNMPADTDALDYHLFLSDGLMALSFNSCDIDGTGGNCALIDPQSGSFAISMGSTTTTAMEGRWVRGFASGVALTADASGGIIDPSITN